MFTTPKKIFFTPSQELGEAVAAAKDAQSEITDNDELVIDREGRRSSANQLITRL